MIPRKLLIAAAAALTIALSPAAASAQDVPPTCDPGIGRQLTQAAIQNAEYRGQMADNNYTRPSPFGRLSCLELLFNGGLDIFFLIPTLDQILNALASAICNMAEQAWAEATRPIIQRFNEATNLGGGGFFPGAQGLGLGNLAPRIGTSFNNSGGISLNTNTSQALQGFNNAPTALNNFGNAIGNGINNNVTGIQTRLNRIGDTIGGVGGAIQGPAPAPESLNLFR